MVFDGLTQTQTDKNHKESKRDFAYPNMFTNNLLGLVLSSIIYMYGVIVMGDDTHLRILADKEVLSNCFMFGLSGAVGQIFIFLTISLFDCYWLTIITTTRKFFSVGYSNFRFGHNFDNMQWIGGFIVMLSTFAEMLKVDLKFAAYLEDGKNKVVKMNIE